MGRNAPGWLSSWQLALVLLLSALGMGCSAPRAQRGEAYQQLQGEALGTTWSIRWRGGPQPAALQARVEALLAQVDAAMSTWRADSELSQVRSATGPVGVSVDTWLVVRAALDVAEATGGAFDPTVQPLVELWGFHGERRQQAPTLEELEAARAQVGWSRVRTGWMDGEPWVDAGGTALDLSAIAKGHAVDRLVQGVAGLGAADAMVEIGGEVRVLGEGPAGAWRIGVDRPEPGALPGHQLEAVVELRHGALATSGDYRNAYDLDGRRIAHTLDPRTGRPAGSAVASATVLAPDCRTADALATALMVLGPPGLERVERWPDVEALLLVAEAEGFVAQGTSGMERYVSSRHP